MAFPPPNSKFQNGILGVFDFPTVFRYAVSRGWSMSFVDTQPVNLRGSKIVLMIEGFFWVPYAGACVVQQRFSKRLSAWCIFFCVRNFTWVAFTSLFSLEAPVSCHIPIKTNCTIWKTFVLLLLVQGISGELNSECECDPWSHVK